MTLSIKSFRPFFLTIVVFMGICLNSTSVQAQFDDSYIRAVDASVGSCGDGTEWSSAYKYLQDALDYASTHSNITEIWVAATATYYPDQDCANPGGTDNRELSFEMIQAVAVYGGFEGGETLLTQRNFITNETILSGDIGTAHVNTDNSYRVVHFDTLSGEPAILDGFTVRDGFGELASGVDGHGGGIEIESTVNAIVRNCFITENEAQFGGGGLAVYISAADGIIEIRNCDFYLNKTELRGGGVIIKSFIYDVSFINCIFRENEGIAGGGVASGTNEPVNFINCEFTENTATGAGNNDGGAVWVTSIGGAKFVNCLLAYNVADRRGGAIFTEVDDSDLELVNCTVVKNDAGRWGREYARFNYIRRS